VLINWASVMESVIVSPTNTRSPDTSSTCMAGQLSPPRVGVDHQEA
jgi:hypothetical protein